MAGMEVLRERERRRPLQTATLRPTADPSGGAAMGRAMQGFGAALGDAASAVGARNVLIADTEAREALNAFYRDRNAIMYGADGALTRKGGNGVDLVPETRERLTALRDQHGAGLNPIARKLFNEKTDSAIISDEEGVARHSAVQTEQYIVGGREATIKANVDNAVLAYADPVKFEEHLGQANADIAALGELQGWAPEQIAAEQAKATSSAVMGQIIRTGATDPLAAKALLDANRGRLSPEHQHTLDTGLQDAVATAQAKGIISDYIGPPGATPAARRVTTAAPGTAATSSTPNIAKLESGGNPRAKNPDSSALGTHQFLRGTYLGEVRKMRRQGLAPWAEGLSDDEIAATRTNPEIEGQVHQFFTANNERVIQSFGLPVNDVTRYIMHFFGEGNGPKVLRALATAPGTPLASVINVAAITGPRSNKWVKGHASAAETADQIGRMLGVDPRSAGGNYIDEVGATEAILQIEDPLVQQKAFQQLNMYTTAEANAKAALSEAAFTQAWQDYKINGTTDIPLDLQLAMGPGKLASLMDTITKETSGALVTDIATYDELMNLSSVAPQEFARTDLSYYYPNLTEADRRKFTDMQAAARGTLAGEAKKQSDPMSVDYDANWRTVEDIVDMAGLKTTGADARPEDVKRRHNLRRQFEDWQREFVEREQRHPNRVELQDAARDLVTPVIIDGGMLGGTDGIFADVATLAPGQTATFNVTVADIPREEKTSIVRQLQAKGVAVNSETVLAAYQDRLQLALRGGVSGVDEIPSDARASLRQRSDGTRRSDEEIVNLYNEWLVTQAQEAQQIDAAHDSDPPAYVPYLPPSVMLPNEEAAPVAPAGVSPYQGATYDGPTNPSDLADVSHIGLGQPVRPADMDYPFGN